MKKEVIGNKLRGLRIKNQFTIEEVSNKLGKDIEIIIEWENGEKPDKESLKNLANLYHVTYYCLVKLYIDSSLKYPFLPFDIFDLKLTRDEQEMLGNMYLKLKTNGSYVTVLEEQNPFLISKNINRLIKFGLINKKINDETDEISFYISPFGLSICEVIEKNPESLFDIQEIDSYSLLKIMSYKYKGFAFKPENYKNQINYTPIFKSFEFLLSDKKYSYMIYENLKNKNYINTELVEFVKLALPEEFYSFTKIESTNETYMRKKAIAEESGVKIEDTPFNRLYDIYVEPSQMGKEFAEFFRDNCTEINYILKKMLEFNS